MLLKKILIPTDGSDLSNAAVHAGVSRETRILRIKKAIKAKAEQRPRA